MSIADDIAALHAAIASGVKRVREGDREVEYQSFDDMQKRAAYLANLQAKGSGQRPVSVILAGYGRG